jgi:iron complex outermembrane receptor protein
MYLKKTAYTLAIIFAPYLNPLVNFAQAETTGAVVTEPSQMPMELPEMDVIGVTPLPSSGQSLEKVSANVQIARDKDITRHEAINLSDFMRRNLGSVFSNETLANPFQPDINYRGFSASPVLGTPIGMSVYQDSVRVNESFGDVVNWDLIPKVAISSIELVPGSNPLFGLNTLGGALAVRTKSGVSNPGTRLQSYGGSFNRWNVEAEHGGTSGNFDWYFAGNVFRDGGFRQFSPSSVNQAFGKIGWENGTTDIDLTYTHANNKLTGNGVAPQSLLATDRTAVYAHPEITSPEMDMVNMTLIHHFSKDWMFSGNGYYRHSSTKVFAGDIELEQDVEDNEFEPDPILNSTKTSQDGNGGSFQLSYLGDVFGFENQAVIGSTFDFGHTDFSQFHHDGVIDNSRGVLTKPGSSRQLRTQLKANNDYYGVFFTDTFSPKPWLNFTGSVRWNRADIALKGVTIDPEDGDTDPVVGKHSFSRANPAGGFTLQPLEALDLKTPLKDFTLFANYNEGFRVPTPVELTCADPEKPCALPTNFVADPPLKPIVSRTYEAGLRGKVNDWVDWNLAFYRTDLQDDIHFINATGTFTRGFFKNVGDTRREGVEVGLKGHTERLNWYTNFSYVDATYQSNISLQNAIGPVNVRAGDRIPSIPHNLIKFGVDYEVLSGWRIGMDMFYASSQFLRGDDNNKLPRVDGYTVVNLNTSYKLTKNLEIFALANNIFDENYNSFGLVNRNAFSDPVGKVESFVSPGTSIAGWGGIRLQFD